MRGLKYLIALTLITCIHDPEPIKVKCARTPQFDSYCLNEVKCGFTSMDDCLSYGKKYNTGGSCAKKEVFKCKEE